ncbi:MAG: deoxyribonuclease IV [Muribaculaceae bacterium]|nr:deoxyribonuclease IV [Muribaculaceae bacterium]
MKYIGAHVASTPTISVAPAEAHELGAGAFAFNLIDPLRWSSPAYDSADVEHFMELCARYGYGPAQILPHSAFVVNLGSPDARKLHLSRITFVDELRRCAQLGIDRLNFHPGSHLKKISEEESLARVAESINYALARTEGVCAVIENTAGQGSALGYSFEHLAAIIGGVDDKSRVGVCIDTCHATAAGYDLAGEGYDKAWADFDRIVGFGYLKGMHLNDAMRPVGSRIDRHAPIGKGTVGADFFARLMADPRFDGIPLILETPDTSLWRSEIEWLKAHCAK